MDFIALYDSELFIFCYFPVVKSGNILVIYGRGSQTGLHGSRRDNRRWILLGYILRDPGCIVEYATPPRFKKCQTSSTCLRSSLAGYTNKANAKRCLASTSQSRRERVSKLRYLSLSAIKDVNCWSLQFI